MNTQETDVIIVGSGPNALSLAAQLGARGVEHRIFGPPMKFWRDMPPGLNLKSLGFATSIHAAEKGFTFPEWCRTRGLQDREPCSMESFAEYGMWFKDRLVSHIEPVPVTRASVHECGFEVATADGLRHRGRRIVFATGLSFLAKTPDCLRGLPKELVSHTFDNHNYEAYRRKHVAVLGGGASAIEAGVLVHEAGGAPQVLVRGSEVVLHRKMNGKPSLFHKLRYPNSVLGPGLRNWVLEKFPSGLHFLPDSIRVRTVKNALGPASPWWIEERFEGKVPVMLRTKVIHAEARGSRIRLTIETDGKGTSAADFDHVICGTGYEYDVDRLAYLAPDLRARLRRIEKAPSLSRHFQSTVKGAYFVGPIATMSFGPLYRFVAAAKFASPTVAHHLADSARGNVVRPQVTLRSPAAVTISE